MSHFNSPCVAFHLLTMRLYNTEKTRSWHQGARVVFSIFYPHFLAKERGASSLLSSSASDVLSSLRESSRLSVPQAAQVGQLLGKRALPPENNKLLGRTFDNIT